jgi:hypothetical protein
MKRLPALSKWDLDQLRAEIRDAKLRALRYGRYPTPHEPERYHERHRHHRGDVHSADAIPRRCIGYESEIRRVTALERIEKYLARVLAEHGESEENH